MIPRKHQNRVNLMFNRGWRRFIPPGMPVDLARIAAFVLVSAGAIWGISYGYRAGKTAAAGICQIPKAEQAVVETQPRPEASGSWILKDLEERVRSLPGVASLERERNSNALRVVLRSDVFFRTGSASLEQDSILTARKIASLFRGFLARTVIEIQGHTDDSPVVRQRNVFRSNWELSLARAASFLHVFEEAGFLKDKLKVVGFGDSRPVVPNRTRSGKAIEANLPKNRRIVLRVIPEGKAETN